MKGRMASLIFGVVIMFTVLGFQLLSHSGSLFLEDKKNHNFKSIVEVMKSGMNKITTNSIWMN